MAHPDLDQLLNSALEFAKLMLSKHGEFFPFGSSMKENGEIVMDGAYTAGEHPPSQEVINLLTRAYERSAGEGELRAAAICADVPAVAPGKADKTDAISVSLEHRSGEAVTVFLSYQKGLFGRISTARFLRQLGPQSSSTSQAPARIFRVGSTALLRVFITGIKPIRPPQFSVGFCST